MQARQARTTARHNRAADPLQRFLPTLLTASGRSGGSLQRVCHRIGRAAPAPRLPASTFPWRKRSTLHEPTQHAAMPDAAHSVGHRTALRPISQDSPAFAPLHFPIRNTASLIATKPISQFKIPCSNFPSSTFLNPRFLIPNSHKGFFCAPFHTLFYKKLYLCPTYTQTRAYRAGAPH